MSLERKTTKNVLLLFVLFIILGCIIYWVYYTTKENKLQEDPMLWKLKEILLPLHPEVKNLKLYKGDKSYTINKEKIYICLKDENNQYYPTNMLIYVTLHELAHLINKDDVGHTEKFHKIFDELLDEAYSMGIYNPSIPPIENYCMYNE
jgi:hypothetical protein